MGLRSWGDGAAEQDEGVDEDSGGRVEDRALSSPCREGNSWVVDE